MTLFDGIAGPEGDTTWMARAACIGTPGATTVFFPTDQQQILAEIAKRICDRCTVRTECLEYAIANNERGIWGGTSERQRERTRRSLRHFGRLPSRQSTIDQARRRDDNDDY